MMAFRHEPYAPWVEVLGDGTTVRVRVETDRGVSGVAIEFGDRYRPETAHRPLRLAGQNHGAVYQGIVPVPSRRLRYRFHVSRGRNHRVVHPWYADWYEVPYLYPPRPVPWAGRTVYALFPDRFARPSLTSSEPASDLRGFYGGTLTGIEQHLDYLKDLGVGVLYLNPVHPSPYYHRYAVDDYYAVDPRLGTLDDFRRLVAAAHACDMYVVLDVVFNHTSDRHPWFREALQDPTSRYRARYRFMEDGRYETFADRVLAMPKLIWTRDVEDDVAAILQWWTDQGVDGFRIDVANEMPRSAWMRLRQRFPEALWFGEIWPPAPGWINDEPYTGVTDYVWQRMVGQAILTGRSATHIAERIQAHDLLYTSRQHAANWVPLGSHDLPRPLRLARGDARRVMMAESLQWAMPGLPVLYYGDEQLLDGGPDPDCRRPFPWDRVAEDPRHEPVRRLIHWRRKHPVVASLPLWRVQALDGAVVVERGWESPLLVVVLNPSNNPVAVELEPGLWGDCLDDQIVTTPLVVSGSTFRLVMRQDLPDTQA